MFSEDIDELNSKSADLRAHKKELGEVCYAWEKNQGTFIGKVSNLLDNSPMKFTFSRMSIDSLHSDLEKDGWDVEIVNDNKRKKEIENVYTRLTTNVNSLSNPGTLVKNPALIFNVIVDGQKSLQWFGTPDSKLTESHCHYLLHRTFDVTLHERNEFYNSHNITILAYKMDPEEEKIIKTILRPTEDNSWEEVSTQRLNIKEIKS